MNYRRTTALLVGGLLTFAACGKAPNDGQPAHASGINPATAWQHYYDVTHPEFRATNKAAGINPATAWQHYYDVTHPDLGASTKADRTDPATAWQHYYDVTHPELRDG